MIAPTLVSNPRRPTPWGLIVLVGLLAVALSFGAVFAALKLSPGRGAPKDEAGPGAGAFSARWAHA